MKLAALLNHHITELQHCWLCSPVDAKPAAVGKASVQSSQSSMYAASDVVEA